jgi:hypothetical protein
VTTIAAPSFSQIKAKVVSVRQKLPKARVIGIHSQTRWTDKAEWVDGEDEYSIVQCDSPLAFRAALRRSVGSNGTTVLITHLQDQDLGDDVLLRLAKRKLMKIDPWQIVRSLFEAQAIDPRLTQCHWIAEALLEGIPPGGFSPARGGFLDAETVWPILLQNKIGFDSESPDLASLLRWSVNQENLIRYQRCDLDFRVSMNEWLLDKAGSAARIVLDCAHRFDRADVVPVGLAAGVIYHSAALGKLEKATGKFEERYLNGDAADIDDMCRLSLASADVVRSLRSVDGKLSERVISRADEILKEVGAESFSHVSDTSRIGFDRRLMMVGEALSAVLASNSVAVSTKLLETQQSLRSHDQRLREDRRITRVEMAIRLVRWLESIQAQDSSSPQTLDEAALNYLRWGSFVDWARLSLRSGDPVRELSESYAKLFDKVTKVQELNSHKFAKLLVDWTAIGSDSLELIPSERILSDFVARLTESALVLVVVIDGMSVAVARELLSDVASHEWTQISEPGRAFNRGGLATIPSVTEFARTSLLCGKLTAGNQETERNGFENHVGLLERCRSGSPPVLFHKAGLSEGDDSILAAEVRKEIASTHRRVVGVVVNAVDDHLLKGEQIDTRWTRDEIKVLPALLHEARIARRLVVLVSDHGHILDCGAEWKVYKDELTGGERWRSAVGKPESNEFLVKGTRVVPSNKQLIAPWSERVRYGIKKNGYHGGLTPQEMVVPIVVLASTDDLPPGWSEQPVDSPSWWDISVCGLVPEPMAVTNLKPVIPKPVPEGMLFNVDELVAQTNTAQESALPKKQSEWLKALLACPVYEEQKRLGGRAVPNDAVLIRLLEAIDERGGKITSAALARAIQTPPLRLRGLLAIAQRVLNVDGYEVLSRDESSDTIQLDRALLLKQFDLVE